MFDGQSFVYAPAETVSLSQRVSALVQPPHILAVTGISGTTYADRSATVIDRVDRHAIGAERNVLIDIAGQSDLLASVSAVDLLAIVEANAADRLAAGFDAVVAVTIPSMTAAGWGWTGAMEAQRVIYNNLLQESSVLDAVADVTTLVELADPTDTEYFSDGLHPTAVAADLMAEVIADAVLGL